MTAKRKHFRTLKKVWLKDHLWPSEELGYPDPEQSVRHRAIAEVICSIPKDDYERLKRVDFQ